MSRVFVLIEIIIFILHIEDGYLTSNLISVKTEYSLEDDIVMVSASVFKPFTIE